MKKILQSSAVQWLLSGIIALYVWFVYLTSRVEYVGFEHLQNFSKQQPKIFASWHGRLIMLPYIVKQPVYILGSEHRDGKLINRAAAYFGMKTIWGSSSKGAAAALRNMLKKVKAGHSLFLTPDGPKGPYGKAKQGVFEVARMTGTPIFPVSYSTTKFKTVKSWDKFMFPKPFGRIVMVMGEPIYLDKKLTEEEKQLKIEHIEAMLHQTQQQADSACA